MENTEFENQRRAYSNYISFFYPNIKWTTTIYKDLYDILDEDLNLTKVSLGDFFLEKFLNILSDNLVIIENEVDDYARNKNFDDIQKEHIFYYKPFLEKCVKELLEKYRLKKESKIKKEKMITNYDKILKELKVIEIIFKSQMDPTIHLGSGIGLARFCNEIFIFSDIELFNIGSYKVEYTSRLENSKNKLLVRNELANIYNISVELYNYYIENLSNHPNRTEIFRGKDTERQIIDSTGYYNFINFRASFCFFGVEKKDIGSAFLQNNFSYRYKNEMLLNFCVQILEFIKLSGVLFDENAEMLEKNKVIKSENKNPFPLIFAGDDSKNYDLFEKFVTSHVIDKYIDLSFIFQQMKYKGYILDVKHLKFMDWLSKNNYITAKDYEDFKEKNAFRSLKKCASGTRLNLYLKLEEEIISDSD
ncbi:hypothetical protein [Flavobacterium sp. KACC 22761]|uniref:hypothetical protein n=1 Tax=Flavobacterium sp. KACC 22761 TaxID=3092665 RepID=UPI002A760CB0|nr:hypothetical protein [Flavobacterium sp. KACC 22761]WPO80429.1 hypothetical protein SCB73_08580 [Flavobacterium sp. KACC 22761]